MGQGGFCCVQPSGGKGTALIASESVMLAENPVCEKPRGWASVQMPRFVAAAGAVSAATAGRSSLGRLAEFQ